MNGNTSAVFMKAMSVLPSITAGSVDDALKQFPKFSGTLALVKASIFSGTQKEPWRNDTAEFTVTLGEIMLHPKPYTYRLYTLPSIVFKCFQLYRIRKSANCGQFSKVSLKTAVIKLLK